MDNTPIYRQPIAHLAVSTATQSSDMQDSILSEKTLNRGKAVATFVSAALLIALLFWM